MKFSISKPNFSSKRWHKIVLAGVFLVLLATAATLEGVHYWYTSNLEPVNSSVVDEKVVTVESGMNSTQIGQLLQSKGLIKNSRAFNWYVSREGVRAKLQAGTYDVSPSQSVQRITQMLVNGEVSTKNLEIPSGMRLDQLKAVFKKGGFTDADIEKGFEPSQYRAHPILKDLPKGSTLEGYIYPETYRIDANTRVQDLVDLSLGEFDKLVTPALTTELAAKGFNLHQSVTLASIIEKETSTLVDQPTVAQVFEKRLSMGMPLGSDVTFIYAAKITGQEATPSLDSPYNTRKNTGLPPGPISNFTISSLKAVAEPSATDYLYFVAGDDKKTYYGKTLQEHEQNVSKYCHTLCQ